MTKKQKGASGTRVPQWLPVGQAAALKGLSKSTIHRNANEGNVRFKEGSDGRWLFNTADVLKLEAKPRKKRRRRRAAKKTQPASPAPKEDLTGALRGMLDRFGLDSITATKDSHSITVEKI